MACSSYRISNTGSTDYIYYNYQRCDNSSWEYQSELKPGENNNFWALNGTVSYSPSYLGSLEIKDKGAFPPSQGEIECLPITIESVVFINNQYVITFGNLSQNCSTIYLQYSTSGGFNPNVNYPSKLVEPCQQVVYIDSLPPTGSVLFRAQQWCDGLVKSDGFTYYTYESPCNSSCQYTMKFVDPTTDSESIFETFLPSFDNNDNATMLLRYWRDIYIKCPDTQESLYDRDQELDIVRSNGVVYLVIYKRVRWLDMQNAGRIVIPTINPPSQDPTLYATPLANYLNSLNLGVTFYPGSEPSNYPGGGVWPNSNADNVVYYRINRNNTDGFDFDNGYYSNEEDINSTLRRYKFKFRVNCFTELSRTATLPCPKSENVNLALCMCIESNVGGFVGPDYSVQSPNNCYDTSIQTGFSGLGNPIPSSKFLFDYKGFYLNPSYDGFCSFAGYNGCYINPACCIPPPIPCYCYLVRINITQELIDDAYGNLSHADGTVYHEYIPCDSIDDQSQTTEYTSVGTKVECLKYSRGVIYYFRNDQQIDVVLPFLQFTCPDCGLDVPPTQDKYPCCPPSPPTFQLNYSEDDQTEACLGFNVSCEDCFYYTQTGVTGITEGMILYTDTSLETLAPAGYYGGIPFNIKSGIVVDEVEGFRIISGGAVSDIVLCPEPTPTPTNTPTVTPTPSTTSPEPTSTPSPTPTLNVKTFQLNYDTTGQTEACLGFSISCEDCYYYTEPGVTGITEGMILYTDISLETLAPAGYYAGGPLPIVEDEVEGFRIVSAGTVSEIVMCPTPTPTNTPTQTGTPTPTPTLNVKTFQLNYDTTGQTEACLGFSISCEDCYYYTEPGVTGITEGMILYTDVSLETLAPAGYYAGGPLPIVVDELEGFRIVSAGTVSEIVMCPTPTPTNTPTVTPTPSETTPELSPTPTPTSPCLSITTSGGVSLTQCTGDSTRLYVNGWETGVTFTITASTEVSFSGNQVSLGGSVTESGLSLTSLDVTVNSIGGISESVFIECTQTTEDVYLYYQIAIIPTALDCPQKILEIYYLVL